MIYLIITFLLSLILIAFMLSYRSYEITGGKEFISEAFRQKSDKKVLTFLNKNIILFSRLYRKISTKLLKIPVVVSHKSHDYWRVVSRKVDLFFEKVKGKKQINNKGSVSLYWQSVSDIRNNKE